MQHRRLGQSAIYVSDICMGTMTFGTQADEAETFRILDRSLEAGINFFDTAENYPVPPREDYAGRTEEFFGRWMRTQNRDKIILATKVCGPSHGWIAGSQRSGMTALDRHNIRSAIEASLKRLQTDYIDLYQTHWPDHGVAYDETMETLDDLVREGKVRTIGCSNENTWGLIKSIEASDRLGVGRYQTIQNNFSLLNTRFMDELAFACRKEGVSLIPYSPLAGGVVSGKYLDGATPDGARFSQLINAGGRFVEMTSRFVNEKSLAATRKLLEIAAKTDYSPVTLATAWSKQHDFVASTIVGVSREDQLDDIFATIDLTLSPDIMKELKQLTKDYRYTQG